MPNEWTTEQLSLITEVLRNDANRIEKLIEVQLANLNTRKCPLYEEVLDTQMYGFSRVIDFNVRVGLLQETTGKQMMHILEQNLAKLYEAMEQSQNSSQS